MQTDTVSLHVVLSGCSGGGKSTLLEALGQRGFVTVPEPGRRIVEEEQAGAGRALPWVDLAAFARRALTLAARDREAQLTANGLVFFDRGLVDAAVALEHAAGIAARHSLARTPRYHPLVFLTPPWPEIYRTDAARQHGFDEAVAEFGRLHQAYRALGYDTVVLPKCATGARADNVLARLRWG